MCKFIHQLLLAISRSWHLFLSSGCYSNISLLTLVRCFTTVHTVFKLFSQRSWLCRNILLDVFVTLLLLNKIVSLIKLFLYFVYHFMSVFRFNLLFRRELLHCQFLSTKFICPSLCKNIFVWFMKLYIVIFLTIFQLCQSFLKARFWNVEM